jgi:hypothetical protein
MIPFIRLQCIVLVTESKIDYRIHPKPKIDCIYQSLIITANESYTSNINSGIKIMKSTTVTIFKTLKKEEQV